MSTLEDLEGEWCRISTSWKLPKSETKIHQSEGEQHFPLIIDLLSFPCGQSMSIIRHVSLRKTPNSSLLRHCKSFWIKISKCWKRFADWNWAIPVTTRVGVDGDGVEEDLGACGRCCAVRSRKVWLTQHGRDRRKQEASRITIYAFWKVWMWLICMRENTLTCCTTTAVCLQVAH